MKKHKPYPDRILTIKGSILFRPSNLERVKPTRYFTLHVRTAQNGEIYELRGRAAFLLLLVDGARTENEVIRRCRQKFHIQSPKFSVIAHKFFENLIQNQFLEDISGSPSRDKRYYDMKSFMKFISSPIDTLFKAPPRTKKILKGLAVDLDTKKKLNLILAKVKKRGIRIKLTRRPTPLFKGYFVFRADAASGKEKLSVGMGVGLTAEGAAMASIGEVLERHFSEGTKPDTFNKSFIDLSKSRQEAFDPESLQYFCDDQDAAKYEEVSNFSRKVKMDWTKFERAGEKRKTLIPAELNVARIKNGYRSGIETTSSGCATGPSADNAKLKAVLELIERDNLLFYWRTRNTPQQLDLSGPDKRLEKIFEILGENKKKVKLFFLKSDFSAITIQAVFCGKISLGEPSFVSACATRTNVVEAIEKSVLELMHIVTGLKQEGPLPRIIYGRHFDNSVWDFSDRSRLYSWCRENTGYRFLFPPKPQKILWSKIPMKDFGGDRENLKRIISEFRGNRLRLYFKNNTPKNIAKTGFYIYRAFSPDLIMLESTHRNRHLGSPRYFKLSSYLNLSRKPKSPNQLNVWPHPLP